MEDTWKKWKNRRINLLVPDNRHVVGSEARCGHDEGHARYLSSFVLAGEVGRPGDREIECNPRRFEIKI